MSEEYKIKIVESGRAKPRPHELAAAKIVARYFESNVNFVRRAASKTPDLHIIKTGVRWELKSPTGGGKHTIQNNLREANRQSENIILDLSNAKLTWRQGVSRTREFLREKHSSIKRIKILTKQGKVIDIK